MGGRKKSNIETKRKEAVGATVCLDMDDSPLSHSITMPE